jgi:hypothetical protein
VLLFVGGVLGWWLEKKHARLSQESPFPWRRGGSRGRATSRPPWLDVHR